MTSEICKKHNVDHTGTICGACYNELLERVKQLEAKRKIFERKKEEVEKKAVCVVNDGGTVFKTYEGSGLCHGNFLKFNTLEQAKKISLFILESEMEVNRIDLELALQENKEHYLNRINNFEFDDFTKG